MIKPIKHYNCPYCGNEFKDNFWSYDHIIPKAIGGSDKFKVISCYKCNSRISKEIEQKAINSPIIDFELKEVLREGFKMTYSQNKSS